MKHYCNRRTPPNKMSNPEKTTSLKPISPENSDDTVVFPPDCQEIMEPYIPDLAQGGAVSQFGGYMKQTSEDRFNYCKELSSNGIYNNMQGSYDMMSVSSTKEKPSINRYLSSYLGKYVCLDLWTANGTREEVCGTLLEIGDNFVVICTSCSDMVTVIDLNSVRYISVFCR